MVQKRIKNASEIYEIIDFIETIRGVRDEVHNQICDLPQKRTLSHYIAVLEEMKNESLSCEDQSV